MHNYFGISRLSFFFLVYIKTDMGKKAREIYKTWDVITKVSSNV